MHHVDAELAEAGAPEHRVHVRAIAVHQPAGFVDRGDDLGKMLVKSPKVLGIVIIKRGERSGPSACPQRA